MISASGDREVKAISAGFVRGVFYDEKGYGKYISIQQEDEIRAVYCHLESTQVTKGQKIEAGQMIGIEGTTGNSTGVHLHLELRRSPYRE